MATLAQLEDALIKADAAGNVEDARTLAAEIRKITVVSASEPEPIQPEQPEYKSKLPQFVNERLALAAGLGVGTGRTVLGGQKLLGMGLGKVGLDKAGGWLIKDAEAGRARLLEELAPFTKAAPISAGGGQFIGEVLPTLPIGGVFSKAAQALKASPQVVQALRTWGMSTGAVPKGFAPTVSNIALRGGAGAVTGGTAGALADPEHIGAGVGIGAGTALALPKTLDVVGAGFGKVYDVLAGRYGTIKAGEIVRRAAGGDLEAMKAITAVSQPGLTGAQVVAPLGNRVMSALGEIAEQNDPNYFRRLAEQQADEQVGLLGSIAGSRTQAGAREARQGTKASLSGYLGPHFQRELDAANTAGGLLPRYQFQTNFLADEAAKRVADVRRLELARSKARGYDIAGAPTLGKVKPQIQTGLTQAADLTKVADEGMTAAAAASLRLGEGSRFVQRQAESLAAHGLKPIETSGITSNLRAMLDDPSIGTNQDSAKGLELVIGQIDEWVKKGGGQIDAKAIHGIRRNLDKNIQSALAARGGDPTSIKAEAARVAMQVKPMLDDAIANAGGTEWRNVLKSWADGETVISQQKMAARALAMFKDDQKSLVKLVGEDLPKDVEKVFGPGNFNLSKQMTPNQMQKLETVAEQIKRDLGISLGAADGNEAARQILRESTPKFKLWNVLDPRIAIANRLLSEGEMRLGKNTAEALFDGMKSGKSLNELLNAMPTQERLKVLQFLFPSTSAGIISATQPEQQE